MDSMERPGLYTVGQAAALLTVSRSQAYNLVKAGVLRTVLVGQSQRVTRDEIERIWRDGAPMPVREQA